MELLSCPSPVVIKDSDLKDWEVIGSGGFGQIYKARHQQWCCDVAIKLLHFDDGKSQALLYELDMMRLGSSPYVLHVHGVFRGRSPASTSSVQVGLVMELMERGTLVNLQKALQGPPPWPLAFRLTHQIALGINFLHSLTPALLHLDLKPSNVLLDSNLNAKLTDFGLARFSTGVTRVSKKDSEKDGGTLNYMPPEAFSTSYNPTKASDIYSYGILLWTIVTGKEPYANARSTIVRFRIPEGDRPPLDEIRSQAAVVAGLTRLIDLMQECWDSKSNQRPTSHECTTVTEELHKMHKHTIHDAVHEVLKKLDKTEEERTTEQMTTLAQRVQAATLYDHAPTGPPPVQEMSGGVPGNQRDNTKVEDPSPGHSTNMCDVDLAPSGANCKKQWSSVEPIQVSPQSHLIRGSTHGKAADPSQLSLKKILSAQFQRQFSSPDTFPCQPSPHRAVSIHLSNVTGFQYGNNNNMYIYPVDSSERKRHPTAPSTVGSPHH